MNESLDITVTAIDDFQHADPSLIIESDVGHQEKKSAKMRLLILQATVKCLIEKGYAKTSTQLVADTAGVSRGALLHHYPNRMALVSATIDYVKARRGKAFISRSLELSEYERTVEGKSIEVYWEVSQTDEAQALLEFAIAARNDEALQALYLPKIKNKAWLHSIRNIFPEWKDADIKALDKATDLIDTFIVGLNIQRDVLGTHSRRIALRQFVFEAVEKFRESEISDQ